MADPKRTIKLNDGVEIPRLGLGVFEMNEPPACAAAVRTALEAGYRHIDTAAKYGNEEAVGRGLATGGVDREEIFVTTKCWMDDFGKQSTRAACEQSLRLLGLDYIDLYLLHWPQDGAMMDAWETMQALKQEGKCRSIGVSNFSIRRFEETFFPHTDVLPSVNQVELHTFRQQQELVDYCVAKGLAIACYSPLARAQRIDDAELCRVAAACGKTPAQVMIRWALQKGYVAIPKSSRPERIRENADVFDFEIAPEDMTALAALDEDYTSAAWRPDGHY